MPLPADQDAFVYVFEGAALVGEEKREIQDGQIARLGAGDAVALACAGDAPKAAPCSYWPGCPCANRSPATAHS